MFKYKKISFLMIVALSLGFSACDNQQQPVQTNTKEKSITTNNKVDNKINGVDLGILTKEDVEKIMSKSKDYNDKSIFIEGKNIITLNSEDFKKTYGSSFIITTPYGMALDICLDLKRKYMELNEDNFIKGYNEWNKKYGTDFNTIRCVANVGGDTMDFIKDVHMVLKVYGSEEKVLQPTKLNTTAPPDLMGIDANPKYLNSVLAQFDAKEIQKLKPTELEIIVIYPDGKEIKQKFEYNKLNQL